MSLTFNPFTGTLDFTGGAGGGGGTPSAPDTSVQFNDGGSFGGDAALLWDKTLDRLSILSDVAQPVSLLIRADDSSNFGFPLAAQLFTRTQGTEDMDGSTVELLLMSHDSAGTIGTMTGLQINGALAGGGAGAITTVYGAKIEDQTAGGANYAIFTGAGVVHIGDDIEMANGQAFGPDTTTAHTALLQAYDVDAAAYVTFGTFLNGNIPRFTLSQPVGGLLAMIAPTTDPGVTGALWNDNGAPAFSA